MKRRYLIAILLASGVALLVLWLDWAPFQRQIMVAIGDPANTCLVHYLPLMTDPASAYVFGERRSDGTITITVRAKNAFGAYVPSEFVCGMTNGRFDKIKTLHQDTARLIGRQNSGQK